ncbi:MAG: flagellar basal body rod protein FlgC [Deltaproteobacteria bacterium]|jgi:flagellar basal-body rod protein FlgC|nr:flagellar basal body rod protein FlgC [Deltaproteobacteria bacterium]
MNLFHSLQISASGLQSQRTVITVISENMANAHTTRTEEGGPYLRKRAVLTPAPVPSDSPFSELLTRRMGPEAMGVKVLEVVQDPEGLKTIFDPSHPDADETGLVLLPNVNLMEEMVALLAASRVFEANVAAFNAAKTMTVKALEIGNR